MALLTPASLATTRGYVRNLILERTGDNGLVTDAEANDIINISARMLWLRIATKWPEAFAQRSAASITVAPGATVAFTAITSGAVVNLFKVLNAYVGPVGASETSMQMIRPFSKATGRHVYEPSAFPRQDLLPARFYAEGQSIGFSPPIVGSFDVRFQFVQMSPDMVGDTDLIWGGFLSPYHDTVAMLAVQMALSKDASGPASFSSLFAYLDTSLTENFGAPKSYLNSGYYASNPYEASPGESRP